MKKTKSKAAFFIFCAIVLNLSCQKEVIYFTEGTTLSYLEQNGLSQKKLSDIASSEGFRLIIKDLPLNNLDDLALGVGSKGQLTVYSPLVPDSIKRGQVVFPPESEFAADSELYRDIIVSLKNPKKIEIYFDQNLSPFDSWIDGFKDYLEVNGTGFDVQPAQLGIFDSLRSLDPNFDAVLVLCEINDPQISKILAEGSRPWIGSFMGSNRTDNNLVSVLVPDYTQDFLKILQKFKNLESGTNFDLKNTRLRLLP